MLWEVNVLDQKDLEAIAQLFDARITQTEKRLDERITQVEKRLDERITQVEKKLDKKVNLLDKRVTGVEDTFYNQLVRTEEILMHRIESVEHKLEEMTQYYRIYKLENASISSILSTLEDHHRRLKALEQKTA